MAQPAFVPPLSDVRVLGPVPPVAPSLLDDRALAFLADLHAQGALSAEEFAAKVRQIVAPD